jgi:hypothetical protein
MGTLVPFHADRAGHQADFRPVLRVGGPACQVRLKNPKRRSPGRPPKRGEFTFTLPPRLAALQAQPAGLLEPGDFLRAGGAEPVRRAGLQRPPLVVRYYQGSHYLPMVKDYPRDHLWRRLPNHDRLPGPFHPRAPFTSWQLGAVPTQPVRPQNAELLCQGAQPVAPDARQLAGHR